MLTQHCRTGLLAGSALKLCPPLGVNSGITTTNFLGFFTAGLLVKYVTCNIRDATKMIDDEQLLRIIPFKNKEYAGFVIFQDRTC